MLYFLISIHIREQGSVLYQNNFNCGRSNVRAAVGPPSG
jgi:hypothetical protein